MKLRDISNATLRVLEFGSHANSIGDAVRLFFGKGTVAHATDTTTPKPWFQGIFNHDNEIEVSKILATLAKTDVEGEGIFYRLLINEFTKGKTWPERTTNFRTRNSFINFIVDHRSPPSQYKATETTKKDKGGGETVAITWNTSPAGPDEALEFVKRCVETIRSAPTEIKGRKLLLKRLEGINAPTPGDTLTKAIEQVAEAAGHSLKSADVLMARRVRELKRNRNFVRRVLDKLF